MQTYLLIGMAALLVTIVAAVGAWWYKHRAVANSGERNAVAVLPLQNMNGDYSVDYLRFALADELSSVLTYARTLEVRPSSMTRKYVELDLDPHKVGAHHNPKGVIANYRDFDKDSYDRNNSNHD